MNTCDRGNFSILLVSVLAAGALIGSALVLKLTELTPVYRVGVSLVPLPFYVAMVVQAVRVTRRLDELKQRIQLEALAIALLGMLLTTVGYGMVSEAKVGLPELTWQAVWGITTVFYICGSLIAWRRYQ